MTTSVVIAFCLGACEEREPIAQPPASEQLDAAFVRGDCASVPMFSAPAAGTVISSRLTSAGGVDEEIRVKSVSGTSVAYTLAFVLKSGARAPMSDRSAHFGFLYASVESNPERRFEYDQDPSALYDLEPAQQLDLGVTENLTHNGQTVSARHTFTVKMLGCGTLEWSGRPVAVKVFRADLANASLDRAGAIEGTTQDSFTAYVAPQYGWPVLKVYADGSREEVRRITLPES